MRRFRKEFGLKKARILRERLIPVSQGLKIGINRQPLPNLFYFFFCLCLYFFWFLHLQPILKELSGNTNHVSNADDFERQSLWKYGLHWASAPWLRCLCWKAVSENDYRTNQTSKVQLRRYWNSRYRRVAVTGIIIQLSPSFEVKMTEMAYQWGRYLCYIAVVHFGVWLLLFFQERSRCKWNYCQHFPSVFLLSRHLPFWNSGLYTPLESAIFHAIPRARHTSLDFRDSNTPTHIEHSISYDFVLIFSIDLCIITIYKAYPEQRRDSYDRYCNGI